MHKVIYAMETRIIHDVTNSCQGIIPDASVNDLIVACTMEATEVANAVNSLLHLSSNDQQSLLAVIEDYFTYHS